MVKDEATVWSCAVLESRRRGAQTSWEQAWRQRLASGSLLPRSLMEVHCSFVALAGMQPLSPSPLCPVSQGLESPDLVPQELSSRQAFGPFLRSPPDSLSSSLRS